MDIADCNQLSAQASEFASIIRKHKQPQSPPLPKPTQSNGSIEQNQFAIGLQPRHDAGQAATCRVLSQCGTGLPRVIFVSQRPHLRRQNNLGSLHRQMVRNRRQNPIFPRHYAFGDRFDTWPARRKSCLIAACHRIRISNIGRNQTGKLFQRKPTNCQQSSGGSHEFQIPCR